MTIDILKRIGLFVALCLAQALVFNRIQLFGCAMPLLYAYFVITFRRNFPKWAALLLGFFMGLILDMFSNTPGVVASSLTLLALVQPYVLFLFVPRDADASLYTSALTMGWSKFFSYTTIMVFIYCLVFFSIEAFCFFNFLQWLLNIVGSTVLTVILVLTLESIRK
jgi:rod shape-determining protein MreD